MDKYTLLELTILEERIGKMIPPRPEYHPEHETIESNMIRADAWELKYKKEQNVLNKIKEEISNRLDEVINAG